MRRWLTYWSAQLFATWQVIDWPGVPRRPHWWVVSTTRYGHVPRYEARSREDAQRWLAARLDVTKLPLDASLLVH